MISSSSSTSQEIEQIADSDAGEHCRRRLLALVEQVRRLRKGKEPILDHPAAAKLSTEGRRCSNG
jgi:hypothetical protein